MTSAHFEKNETDPALLSINAVLASLAPPAVQVGSRRIAPGDLSGLHPDEALVVANAVPKRQHEFATGRALLHELIGPGGPIPVAPNRSPVLPDGVRGSLAHDVHFAVAAIARNPSVIGLGIDIEPNVTLSASMASIILRADDPPIDAHLAFTLKEAVYKAWSSLGGRLLDHHEVRLHLSGTTFRGEVLEAGASFSGRFGTAEQRWLALVVVLGNAAEIEPSWP